MTYVPDHSPVRILCVEDDESHLELFRSYLEKLPFAIELLHAGTSAVARDLLAREPIDAVVVDYHLPDGSGLDLIEHLAVEGGAPVIAVSGVGSERVAVSAMKRGAADYLKKDGELRTALPRALVEALERRSRRIERKRATRELELLAFTDPLTGLRNRRYFEDVFDREFSASLRYGHPLSLLVLDLDHFKLVNDTHGHPFGDRVLVETAQKITEIVRVSDLVARFGGEEIVVLLPCTPLNGADILCRRILRGIASLPLETAGTPFHITASGGLATLTAGGTYSTSAKLFAAADKALYRAKAEGRDRLALAPPDTPGSDGTTKRITQTISRPPA